MDRRVVVLGLLLVGSNLAWWIAAWDTATDGATPANPASHSDSDGDTPSAREVDEFRRQLAAAKGRAGRLESELRAARGFADAGRASDADTARTRTTGGTGGEGNSTQAEEEPDPKSRLPLDRRQIAKQVEAWTKDVQQVADPAKRDAALAEIRAALAGNDHALTMAALMALPGLFSVKFPRDGLRDLVEPHLEHSDPWARRAAWYSISALGRQPGDLDRLLDAAQDGSPAFGQGLTQLIVSFSNRKPRGRAAETISTLLASGSARARRDAIWGLQHADLPDSVQDRLIAVVNGSNARLRHDAIYFSLSTMNPKSKKVIDTLLDAAEDTDPNIHDRALWGLHTGVTREHGPHVVGRILKLLRARSAPQIQSSCLRIIANVGGPADAHALQELADDPQVSDAIRKRARRIAESLSKR